MQRRKFIAGFIMATGIGTKGNAMDCVNLQPDWEFVADTVMGGVSTGQVARQSQDGRDATRLTGAVSLENNGGFIQMAFNPAVSSVGYDASRFSGMSFAARGNGQEYAISLRTTDLTRPWQSYRATFISTSEWQQITLPFDVFAPSNTDKPLRPSGIRRIGIIAVGRAFEVDVSVADLCFVA